MAQAHAQDFSPADLARRTIERRAVEAAIWGMPIVSADAMRQAYWREVKHGTQECSTARSAIFAGVTRSR